jgi:hypothetical protein
VTGASKSEDAKSIASADEAGDAEEPQGSVSSLSGGSGFQNLEGFPVATAKTGGSRTVRYEEVSLSRDGRGRRAPEDSFSDDEVSSAEFKALQQSLMKNIFPVYAGEALEEQGILRGKPYQSIFQIAHRKYRQWDQEKKTKLRKVRVARVP